MFYNNSLLFRFIKHLRYPRRSCSSIAAHVNISDYNMLRRWSTLVILSILLYQTEVCLLSQLGYCWFGLILILLFNLQRHRANISRLQRLVEKRIMPRRPTAAFNPTMLMIRASARLSRVDRRTLRVFYLLGSLVIPTNLLSPI